MNIVALLPYENAGEEKLCTTAMNIVITISKWFFHNEEIFHQIAFDLDTVLAMNN